MRRADDKDKDKLNNAEGADPKYAAPRIIGVASPIMFSFGRVGRRHDLTFSVHTTPDVIVTVVMFRGS